MLAYKQDDFVYDARIRNPNTVLHYYKLDGSFDNFLGSIPMSIFNFFCRPNIEFSSNYSLIVFRVENLFLFFSLMFSLFKGFQTPNKYASQLNFVFCIFIFSSAIVLGSIVPVLGNLLKYRSPVIIILFGLIFFNSKTKTQQND